MRRSSSLARAVGAALLGTSVVACSLLGGPLTAAQNKPAPPPPPAAPPPPPAAPPVEASKFTINPRVDDDVVGVVQITHATKQDTLTDIGRRFSVGYNEMQRANPGVDMWLPGAGRQVVVPTQFVLPDAPHKGIVVNIAAMRLYYFPPHRRGEKQIVYTYPIGIGRVGWQTPEGVTRVVAKVKNPVWRVPKSIRKEHREEGDILPAVVPPGPDNPLGNRALFLGWPGYLIHGTNKPVGVGMRVSHGCMHLFPEEIEQLFKMVPLGTEVRVVNQPFVFGWYRGELYMEAFGSLKDDRRDWHQAEWKLLHKALGKRIEAQLRAHHEHVRWDLVTQLANDPRGIPVAVTDPDASLQQVLADAPRVVNELPAGSAWDGKTDLPMDQKTFEQVMTKIDATGATQGNVPTQHADPAAAGSAGTAAAAPGSAAAAPGTAAAAPGSAAAAAAATPAAPAASAAPAGSSAPGGSTAPAGPTVQRTGT
jgi:L,D-transpeptidase ErfK/SrfK